MKISIIKYIGDQGLSAGVLYLRGGGGGGGGGQPPPHHSNVR